MISINQALEIRKQILNGEWVGDARATYHFKPEDITCYNLKKDCCELWVANGLWSLGLKFIERRNFSCEYKYVKIPFLCKLIIYRQAMRAKASAEAKELKRVRSAAKLAVAGLTKHI